MLKRTIDILLSGLALFFLTPLLALIALAILMDSGPPVFYGQERVGRQFQPFRMWKFRSMLVSNEGPSITVAGDTRVTRVGKFIRATKFDELPQFWNVLRGDMSLVGPRPEIPKYVAMYENRYRAILAFRPGMTDLASIRFRDEENLLAEVPNPTDYYACHLLPTKLGLAEEYLRKKSILFDLCILLETALSVLRSNIN
jgi:lipopolysaccharide/colanic/teichoic acid biosynthesis glycosyltransferase